MAEAYFRAGADKVSIGSDAVDVARKYRASGKADGSSSIEAISHVYGRQAVVVSIDPRRVWVRTAADADGHNVVNHADAVGGDRGVSGGAQRTQHGAVACRRRAWRRRRGR